MQRNDQLILGSSCLVICAVDVVRIMQKNPFISTVINASISKSVLTL